MRDVFFDELKSEMMKEERLLKDGKEKLALAPEGSLSIRKRAKGASYYQNIPQYNKNGYARKQLNISDNPVLIRELTEKRLQKEIIARCENNLPKLQKLLEQYQPASLEWIASEMDGVYKQAMELRQKIMLEERLAEPYPKCPYNPKYHIHTTEGGEMVRSKSEQLLANTLYSYGIPFHYEEEFIYRIGVHGLKHVYPDFTILLPDGDKIIWEHLGLLHDLTYCERTARKLNLYQKNGYLLGQNLILTMDDCNGTFSSVILRHVIETQILPKLYGMRH
ncbi:hypothetical protein ACDL92_09095 [Ihubacter sp. mB4P-1]|uniref:hypothetical protein n=1 Tax=Ihubacter sp. mB4P-1 TaxID=3242370 RepID=UPI00137A61D1